MLEPVTPMTYYKVTAFPNTLPAKARMYAGRIGKLLPANPEAREYLRLQFGTEPDAIAVYHRHEVEPVTVLEQPEIAPDDFVVGFLPDGRMFEFDVDTANANALTGRFTQRFEWSAEMTFLPTEVVTISLANICITQVNPMSWMQERAAQHSL